MTATPLRRGLRSGPLITATWLIGLGVLFLVRDFLNLGWGEAWPLFIIWIGVGTLVSQLVRLGRAPIGAWSLVWPLAWIAVGSVLLLSTTQVIETSPGELIGEWWPVVPIVIGAWFLVAAVWPWRRPIAESLSLPLEGAAEGDVRIRFGGGELELGRAPVGALVEGTFLGGVTYRRDGPGSVELEPDAARAFPLWDRLPRWRLGLNGEVPLELRVESGAARVSLDLTELLVRRVELKTGASETELTLPRAAGASTARVEAGAASVDVRVPPDVAARIRSRMALGSTSVDEGRFPRRGDVYESEGYEQAPNRVEIEIAGGMGSVHVR